MGFGLNSEQHIHIYILYMQIKCLLRSSVEVHVHLVCDACTTGEVGVHECLVVYVHNCNLLCVYTCQDMKRGGRGVG